MFRQLPFQRMSYSINWYVPKWEILINLYGILEDWCDKCMYRARQLVTITNFTYIKISFQHFNPLMPNVNYSGRTALLTSKVAFYIFIQQI